MVIRGDGSSTAVSDSSSANKIVRKAILRKAASKFEAAFSSALHCFCNNAIATDDIAFTPARRVGSGTG